MRSIRVKLVFSICVLFILIGALIYIPLSKILPEKITSQILKRDLEIARYLSIEAKDLLLLNDKIALSILLHDNLNRLEDAQYLFVRGPEGEIIAHTFGERFPSGLLNFNLTEGEHKIKKFLSEGRSIYDIAVPVLDGSIGTVHLGVFLESGREDIAEVARINDYVAIVILIGLGIGIVVFLIIGFLFSNQIIRLKDLAVRIGKGDLDTGIDMKSKDEIGDLALAFNEMTQNLKEKIHEIKRLHIIEERNRIALDLHDGRTQDLANIIKRIELCEILFRMDPEKAHKELAFLKENTRDVLNRTRQVIFNLKSSPEDVDFNLLFNLRRYIRSYQQDDSIKVKLRIADSISDILPEKSKTIFYIITEALNNVKKHSQAKNVNINFKRDENDKLTINIHDDGRGFDVERTLERVAKSNKLGLISMRYRARSLGGETTITSKPQNGTQITINIPLKKITMETYYEI